MITHPTSETGPTRYKAYVTDIMNIAGVPLTKYIDRNILILCEVCNVLVIYDR